MSNGSKGKSSVPPPPSTTNTRTQTTVSVHIPTLDALDKIAKEAGISRSKLVDLAIRRFVRWAAGQPPDVLNVIVNYEITEQVSGFLKKVLAAQEKD